MSFCSDLNARILGISNTFRKCSNRFHAILFFSNYPFSKIRKRDASSDFRKCQLISILTRLTCFCSCKFMTNEIRLNVSKCSQADICSQRIYFRPFVFSLIRTKHTVSQTHLFFHAICIQYFVSVSSAFSFP